MAFAIRHNPEDWIIQIFSAKSVEKGGVVRRSTAWVDHEIGRERFIAEVRSRGFHLIEGGGQFVVICNPAPIRLIV